MTTPGLPPAIAPSSRVLPACDRSDLPFLEPPPQSKRESKEAKAEATAQKKEIKAEIKEAKRESKQAAAGEKKAAKATAVKPGPQSGKKTSNRGGQAAESSYGSPGPRASARSQNESYGRRSIMSQRTSEGGEGGARSKRSGRESDGGNGNRSQRSSQREVEPNSPHPPPAARSSQKGATMLAGSRGYNHEKEVAWLSQGPGGANEGGRRWAGSLREIDPEMIKEERGWGKPQPRKAASMTEEERAKQLRRAEAEAKRQAELAAEREAKRKALAEEMERKRREKAAAAAREAAAAEEEARRKKEAEAEARRKRDEEAARRRREAEEEAARRRREAEEAARLKREAEEEARRKADEEARLRREAEEEARRKADEEARRKRDEAERAEREREEAEMRKRLAAEERERRRQEGASRVSGAEKRSGYGRGGGRPTPPKTQLKRDFLPHPTDGQERPHEWISADVRMTRGPEYRDTADIPNEYAANRHIVDEQSPVPVGERRRMAAAAPGATGITGTVVSPTLADGRHRGASWGEASGGPRTPGVSATEGGEGGIFATPDGRPPLGSPAPRQSSTRRASDRRRSSRVDGGGGSERRKSIISDHKEKSAAIASGTEGRTPKGRRTSSRAEADARSPKGQVRGHSIAEVE